MDLFKMPGGYWLEYSIIIIFLAAVLIYTSFEIHAMRIRVIKGERVERRSIIGIVISLVLLGFAVAVIIPWQTRTTQDKALQLKELRKKQEEQLGRLNRGEGD